MTFFLEKLARFIETNIFMWSVFVCLFTETQHKPTKFKDVFVSVCTRWKKWRIPE